LLYHHRQGAQRLSYFPFNP